MSVLLDGRWTGHFGIARFGREVLDRLPQSWARLENGSPWRPAPPRRGWTYSPGFNVGLGHRQLLTIHDLIHLDEPLEASWKKRLYYERVLAPVVRRAGLVHTVSDYSKQRIEEWLSDERVEVVNVGNSVDLDVFASGQRAPEEGLLLYVGNLKPHKNARVLWQALRLRRDYRLAVVTADVNQAQRWTAEFGVLNRVEIQTDLHDGALAALYARSSGLLFPSRFEGFGLPALEARAGGVPVAYSETCAVVGETVGQCGVAVSGAESAEAWAHGMDALVERDWGHVFRDAPRPMSWDKVASNVRTSIEKEING